MKPKGSLETSNIGSFGAGFQNLYLNSNSTAYFGYSRLAVANSNGGTFTMRLSMGQKMYFDGYVDINRIVGLPATFGGETDTSNINSGTLATERMPLDITVNSMDAIAYNNLFQSFGSYSTSNAITASNLRVAYTKGIYTSNLIVNLSASVENASNDALALSSPEWMHPIIRQLPLH